MSDDKTGTRDGPASRSIIRFWARSNDDPVKVIVMTVTVAFLCALVVSTAEQVLGPKRQSNIESLREAQMTSMLANLPGLESILKAAGVDSLLTRLVDLGTGNYTDKINPMKYDAQAAESDPEMRQKLPSNIDIAGLGYRANVMPVHLLSRDDQLRLIILPVHGAGYQSVIRAWLVLSGDLNTVVALSVFDQSETPGLGSRVQDDTWLAQFNGRRLRDDKGTLRLKVVKGQGTNDYEIDGITGATRTGNGINNLIEFWLGDYGYGPFLTTLSEASKG